MISKNKDEIKKDEIKRGLECCSTLGYENICSNCPYQYRCIDLIIDALNFIKKQENEIERLKAKNKQLKKS